MVRSWFAVGIGLVLAQSVQSNSAIAQQQEGHRHPAQRTGHHHVDHRGDQAAAQKDMRALTSLKKEVHDLRQQVAAVAELRRELTDLRGRIWGPALPLSLAIMPRPQSAAVVEPKLATLKLPDLSIPARPQAPVNPATANLPAVIEERPTEAARGKSAVEEAKTYLINTATPGYTMTRQGVPLAIGRLHPEFIVKLAAAIKLAREAGLTHAGLYSAYRPPAFGVGGFSDKFNSMHSYGLAVDMTGIGGPGSKLARLWQTVVRRVGLYLPYGPNNRKEFNHTQLVPSKTASSFLRRTITASAPKDLRAMWLASGITKYVNDVTTTPMPTLAASASVPQRSLPVAPLPQQDEPTTTPRRARRSGSRKTARQDASRARPRVDRRKNGKSARRPAKARTR
ncbi:MAG TPA: hypothetical protein VIY51_06370 [Xanthobacteraceae bacterium]